MALQNHNCGFQHAESESQVSPPPISSIFCDLVKESDSHGVNLNCHRPHTLTPAYHFRSMAVVRPHYNFPVRLAGEVEPQRPSGGRKRAFYIKEAFF